MEKKIITHVSLECLQKVHSAQYKKKVWFCSDVHTYIQHTNYTYTEKNIVVLLLKQFKNLQQKNFVTTKCWQVSSWCIYEIVCQDLSLQQQAQY